MTDDEEEEKKALEPDFDIQDDFQFFGIYNQIRGFLKKTIVDKVFDEVQKRQVLPNFENWIRSDSDGSHSPLHGFNFNVSVF